MANLNEWKKNTLNFSYNASTQHKHVQYFERQYIIRLSITDYIQKGSKLHIYEMSNKKQKTRYCSLQEITV